MDKAAGGKTYAEVSSEYNKLKATPGADPEQVAKLGELRMSQFMGSTLRGLLLNAYAFGTMGKIAGYAAIASFAGAGLMLLLGLLGLRHAAAQPVRSTTPTRESVSVG